MKFLKWLLILLISVFAIAETYIFASGNTYLNTLFPLTIFSGKMGPDIDEVTLFKHNEVSIAFPQPWANSNKTVKLSDSVLQLMESYETVSFVVIKNDTVQYEKHWEGYTDSSLINSFSMAKSITAMLVGCAFKDGLIKSVNEPVANYLDEFKVGDLQKITIKHLLTMSSGLGFKEDYSSMFSWPAEAYYGSDVNSLTIEQAKVCAEPGKTWFYKGGDTQLLGIILKKVTGKTVAQYASEKLWKPMGAEQPAFWSLDEQGMEKVSCCWYSNAKDFARIAKLMMNYGNWNGLQIIDSAYVVDAITPVILLDSKGNKSKQYGYQWWLMNHKGHDVFYARGIRGQYIFAIPDTKTIAVRLGHKRAKKEGDELPEDIFVYLDAALSMQ
jgi:CubicO group peptidase (beta-lactamase class C family)